MIHNPQVNADLLQKGVKFLHDTNGNSIIPLEELNSNDVVMIPAFGTTLELEKIINDKGIEIQKYNTTCPFVEKVWNRSEQIAKKGYSIIIHGKPKHEETRATFSHAASNTPTLIVNDMNETKMLGAFILGKLSEADFIQFFDSIYANISIILLNLVWALQLQASLYLRVEPALTAGHKAQLTLAMVQQYPSPLQELMLSL
jgi:4-hydroxy-3-methylbut-2-enyl diphosphate reductase